MAEKVIVKSSSSDLDGAQFENAATEATLKRLVDLIEKQKPGSGGSITQAAQKSKEQGINPSVAKQTTEAFSTIGGVTKKASSSIGSMALDFTKFLASGPIAALSTAFIFTKDTILKSMDALRETGSVGASFNGSLLELNKAAAESGMSLQEYSMFVKENSQTMAALGGTATEGAKRMGILSKELRSSEVGEQMMALGYTSKDLNSGLADYIQNEALRGRLQGKSDAELRKGAGEYVKQMSELSRLTGESAEALQKKMNEELRDARVQALMAGMSEDQQKDFQSRLAYINSISPELGNAFKDLAAGVADNDTANEIRRLNPELAAMAEGIQRGVIPSQSELQKQLQKTNSANQDFMKSLGEGRGAIVASNEGMRGLAKIGADLNRVQNQNLAAAKEEGTQYGQFTKVVMNAGNILNTFVGDIKSAFLDSKIFKYASDGVSWLSGKLLEFRGPVTDLVKSILNGTNPVFQQLSSILNSVAVPAFNFVSDVVKNYVAPAFNKIVEVIKSSVDPTLAFLGKAFTIASDITKNYVVPAFNKIVEVIKSSVDPTLNFLSKAFDTAGSIVKNYVVPAFSAIVTAITSSIEPTLNFLGGAFKIAGDIINNVIVPVFNGLFSIVKSVSGLIGAVLMPVINESTRVFSVITSVLGTVLKPVIDLVGSAFGTLTGGVSSGLTPAVGVVTGTIDGLTSVVKTITPYLVTLGEAFLVYKGIVLAVSGAKAAYSAVVTTLSSIQAAWAARTVVLTTVTTGLAVVQGVLASGMTILAGAVAFLTSPVTLVVGAIALLLGSLKALYDSGWELGSAWEAISDGFLSVFLEIKKAFSDVIDYLKSFAFGGKSKEEKKKAEEEYEAEKALYKARSEARDKKREELRKERGSEDSVFNFSAKKPEEKKPEEQTANSTALTDLTKNIQAGNLTQQQTAELLVQREKKLEGLAPDLAKAVKEGSDTSKSAPIQKNQTDILNDKLEQRIKALDPSGRMSNEQLLKALIDSKGGAAGIGNEELGLIKGLVTQLKTPTSTTPQPPRDYNAVRWNAEDEASKRGLGGRMAEEAGERAVAQAKAEDEAKEAAANQVATLNTVSDGIGKLSGIMSAILDLQLQQVEAQKDLVNAAKGKYNVTS